MRAILFTVTFLLLIILSNIVLSGMVGEPPQAKEESAASDSLPALYSMLRIGVFMVLALVTVYFFRTLIDKKDLVSLGLSIRKNFNDAAAGFFLGLFLLGTGSLILFASGNLHWTGVNFNPMALLTGLAGMMIVAFSEELVFRGYILHNLMLSMNKWLALLYSSLLFALFHFSNPGMNLLSFINVFLAGLLLGINYIFTKNLWFGILFHFGWNFYQGSILGYKVSGVPLKSLFEQELSSNSLLTGGPFGFEGSLIAGILTLLSFLALAWVYEKRQPF